MRVAVNEVPGRVLVNEPPEALESPVTSILCIMDMPRRCMGDDNVDAFLKPHCCSDTPNRSPHLPFSVLKGASVIPARPFQSEDLDPLELNQFGVDIDASVRML